MISPFDTFEVETFYVIFDQNGEEKWSGSSLEGHNLDDICTNLKDQFKYGFWTGFDSREWAYENLKGDFFLIDESIYRRSNEEMVSQRILLLLNDEEDAVAFKLRWI